MKRHLFAGIEAADHLEPSRILGIEGVERGIALGRESVVVAWPILVSRLNPCGTTEQAGGGESGKFPGVKVHTDGAA